LSFEIGDFVYLMVSPIRGLRCFKVRGKFTPIFIGPFKIMKKRGQMGYQLELPLQLSDVHDVFHVSQLKKYLRAPEEQIPMEDLNASEELSYQEYPVKILETSERVTRNKRIKMCTHYTEEEVTWEREEELKVKFSNFFPIRLNLGDEIHFKGGMSVTPYFSQRNKTLKIIE
jgi:hypothetical protein